MYTYYAKVIKVIDGDTIDLDIDLGFHIRVTKRIRLSFINAPEMNARGGKESKAYVQSFLEDQQQVIIKTELDKTDKYGRLLGEIFLEGSDTSLNKSMLDKGYAALYN